MNGKELNVKEREFCDLYAKTGDKEASYKSAFRTEAKNAKALATKLLRKPHVNAYVADKRAEYSEMVGLSDDWIIGRMMRVVSYAMGDETITAEVWDKEQNRTRTVRVTKTDFGAANTGLANLAKYKGLIDGEQPAENDGVAAKAIIDAMNKITGDKTKDVENKAHELGGRRNQTPNPVIVH